MPINLLDLRIFDYTAFGFLFFCFLFVFFFLGGGGGKVHANRFNNTNWVAVVTQTGGAQSL